MESPVVKEQYLELFWTMTRQSLQVLFKTATVAIRKFKSILVSIDWRVATV